MRIGLALLLLLNFGVLMWGAWYRDAGSAMHVAQRPDIGAERLRKLDEPGVVLEPRTEELQGPLLRSEDSTACYEIGPFEAGDALVKAVKQLDESGIKHEDHPVEIRQEAGQRIFLAGFADQKAAEVKRSELSRLGIKDHAVMAEPDKKFSVALGIFMQTNLAEKRLQELRKKGIQAQRETLYRTVPQRWLKTGPMTIEQHDRLKQALGESAAIGIRPAGCAPAANEPGKRASS